LFIRYRYNVVVSGNIGGKKVSRTYLAIRYGVLKTGNSTPKITGINKGTFIGMGNDD